MLSFFIGVIKLDILMIEKSEREHQSFKMLTRNLIDNDKKTYFIYSPPFNSRKNIFQKYKRGRLVYEDDQYYLENRKHEKISLPKNLN